MMNESNTLNYYEEMVRALEDGAFKTFKIPIAKFNGPDREKVTVNIYIDPAGAEVSYQFSISVYPFAPNAYGGEGVVVTNIYRDYAFMANGYSACSKLDKFSNIRGRNISISRAMHNANLDRETRKMIWSKTTPILDRYPGGFPKHLNGTVIR